MFFFLGSFFWLIKGNLADPRMRAASKSRGIEITSISRPIRPSDFRDFDIILPMDKQNRGRKNYRFHLVSLILVFLSFVVMSELVLLVNMQTNVYVTCISACL